MNRAHKYAFQSLLAGQIKEFLAAKRALGKRFLCEEKVLRLLDHYLIEQQVEALEQITPELVESFVEELQPPAQHCSPVFRLAGTAQADQRLAHSCSSKARDVAPGPIHFQCRPSPFVAGCRRATAQPINRAEPWCNSPCCMCSVCG
jgi:hypothetical protein